LRWDPTQYQKAVVPPEDAVTAKMPAVEIADPNETVAPGMLVPGGADGLRAAPGAGPPSAGTADVALILRLPDGDGTERTQISVTVEPGQQAAILGLIRNQSAVVDNFDLSIRGIPEDWWTIVPATAYLVPYGSGGTYEQEVEVHIHPPRTPLAQARAWPFEVVATSRAYGGQVASTPASVTVGPYFDVATDLRPARAGGRLRASYRLTVRNRANARTKVTLEAHDTDDECQFRFKEKTISLEPGNALECSFTVFPPHQIWLGRTHERQFEVTAVPVDAQLLQPPPAQTGVYRQGAWLPWWLAVVVPVAIAAIVLLISLQPYKLTVPSIKGLPSAFAAQKLLQKVGLKIATQPSKTIPDASKPAGSIADQSPAAGGSATSGATVNYEAYVGLGTATVPSILNDNAGRADEVLRQAGVKLGSVSPQPLNPYALIIAQIPIPGAVVPAGTQVNVTLAQPAPTTTGTGTTTTGTATGTPSGGPKPIQGGSITLPALTGAGTAVAAQLAQLGLNPKIAAELATVPAGQVVSTMPGAGAKLKRGAIVKLLISAGQPELAYDNATSVIVVDPPSTKPSVSIPAGPEQVEPAWSPDGSELVYSQSGALAELSTKAPGGPAKTLTQPAAGLDNLDPSFAPTTKTTLLAFVEHAATGVGSQLCFLPLGAQGGSPSCVGAAGWDLGGQADWSPDGKAILVFGARPGDVNFGLLEFTSSVAWSPRATDWTPRLVTDASTNRGVIAGAFSPDGKHLALVSDVGSGAFTLYLTKPGDFKPKPADALPVPACQISWRSDSRQLAVMQANGPCTALATGTIVAIDPSNPKNPTTLVTGGAHPAWQPIMTGG
jgi:beta-lactam-binding protein with PASTA domain